MKIELEKPKQEMEMSLKGTENMGHNDREYLGMTCVMPPWFVGVLIESGDMTRQAFQPERANHRDLNYANCYEKKMDGTLMEVIMRKEKNRDTDLDYGCQVSFFLYDMEKMAENRNGGVRVKANQVRMRSFHEVTKNSTDSEATFLYVENYVAVPLKAESFERFMAFFSLEPINKKADFPTLADQQAVLNRLFPEKYRDMHTTEVFREWLIESKCVFELPERVKHINEAIRLFGECYRGLITVRSGIFEGQHRKTVIKYIAEGVKREMTNCMIKELVEPEAIEKEEEMAWWQVFNYTFCNVCQYVGQPAGKAKDFGEVLAGFREWGEAISKAGENAARCSPRDAIQEIVSTLVKADNYLTVGNYLEGTEADKESVARKKQVEVFLKKVVDVLNQQKFSNVISGWGLKTGWEVKFLQKGDKKIAANNTAGAMENVVQFLKNAMATGAGLNAVKRFVVSSGPIMNTMKDIEGNFGPQMVHYSPEWIRQFLVQPVAACVDLYWRMLQLESTCTSRAKDSHRCCVGPRLKNVFALWLTSDILNGICSYGMNPTIYLEPGTEQNKESDVNFYLRMYRDEKNSNI